MVLGQRAFLVGDPLGRFCVGLGSIRKYEEVVFLRMVYSIECSSGELYLLGAGVGYRRSRLTLEYGPIFFYRLFVIAENLFVKS